MVNEGIGGINAVRLELQRARYIVLFIPSHFWISLFIATLCFAVRSAYSLSP